MNKNQIKKIESIMKDLEIEKNLNKENQKYIMKKSDFKKLSEYLDFEISEKDIQDNFELMNQIHISRDRDIKIDSKKISGFGIKLIYHRKKDSSKEYRIFISYKDENKNLRRIRFINEEIRKIHNDEKKIISFYNKISESDIKKMIS